MSRAYTSVFAGFATLCLGLIAASSIPVGLPTALTLAFGETLNNEQLGIIELVLLVITVFLSVVFVTDGVISGIRGRGGKADDDRQPEPDDSEWLERLISH